MRVVFITTELEPLTPGAAGTTVKLLSEGLQAEGHEATVILVTEKHLDRLPPGVTQVRPDEGETNELGPDLARSRAAAQALAAIVPGESIGLVEFQDFDGLAFATLVDRNRLGLDRTRIGVRIHGYAHSSLALQDDEPDDVVPVRIMETESYRMADMVMAPSEALRELVVDRYELEHNRVLVGHPPIPPIEPVPLQPALRPEIVCLSSTSDKEGANDFIAAAIRVLGRHTDATVRVIELTDRPMETKEPPRGFHSSQIPPQLVNRFRYEIDVDRSRLAEAVASAWMVVLPSPFDLGSATYAVQRLGLPVIVPDRPLYRGDFGEESGALLFEPSVGGLEAAIERVISEEELRVKLTGLPPPERADPLAPYKPNLVALRHSRSQSGLATAAVKRLEAASVPTPSVISRFLRRALRAMPGPLARMAVRRVPQAIKDRVRSVANWGDEAARRAQQDRIVAVRKRIARGDFPPIDEPLVTIVIACFDQGRFLEDALTSVFEQTFPYFEVIVVDDGSSDPETMAYLDRLDWPRVQLVRQENRGPAAARNTGMTLARAPFLVPLDADDELAPDYLAEMLNALDRNPEAAYAHCWAELFGDQRTLFVTRPFNPYQLLISNPVIGCVVMRRDAWAEVGGYDESMTGHEDWELWIRFLKAGWKETGVRRALFRYRKHGVSMSVVSEARFEQGRAEIVRRHPDLYESEALITLKRSWYPWVSIILSPEQVAAVSHWEIEDAELVTIGDDYLAGALASRKGWGCQSAVDSLEQAVATARGKFLIVADGVTLLDPESPTRLAEALEEHPQALGAGPPGAQRPALWRHWSVVDRSAPHRSLQEVDGLQVLGHDGLGAGAFPQPGWDIKEDLEAIGLDLPIQRQPPEEEGRIPEWLS
jgi:GT2 family glycosyltransferase/glycosyltransferase involved in cell wall biosynthesis